MTEQTNKNFVQWNEAMALKYNPENYYKSHNFIIRFIENLRKKTIIKMLNPQNDDKIIELGCGAGNLMEAIKSARELVGIDLSDFLLNLARSKKYFVNTKLIKGNIENLPEEIVNDKFDKIYCSEVLEHVEHPEQVLKEIKKIIKKNGILIVSIPNENLINKFKDILIKFKIFNLLFPNLSVRMTDEWHIHLFNLLKFKNLIANDYSVIKISRIPLKLIPLRYVIKLKIKYA
ncbi:MAG: class I SAM-dependent methyltransferase [Candidatus Portnoybacteria bacterium]|nr:class I SAM-dependent methyltransferase [Candidatus Portnoybacteria bacterium]HPH52023.1 class I SAM-dependent methyltransferase [Candidatus Portnoybacteria bacterium]